MTNEQRQTLNYMRELLANHRYEFDRSREGKILLAPGLRNLKRAYNTLVKHFGKPTVSDPFIKTIAWEHVVVNGVRHNIYLEKADGNHDLGIVRWM